MPKDSKIVVDGIVTLILPNTCFEVKIDSEGYPEDFRVRGYISGKMRMNYIKIIRGDRVRIELDPYDPEKGRIVYRYKQVRGAPSTPPPPPPPPPPLQEPAPTADASTETPTTPTS